jgi:NADH:ubiquinone oxidoreductase subunit
MTRQANPNSADEQSTLDHRPLRFGKYRGKTPAEISEIDPQYLVWMHENVLTHWNMSDLLYRECVAEAKKKQNRGAYTPAPKTDRPSGTSLRVKDHFDLPDESYDDMSGDVPF